jgi:hypothetical protein
LKKLEPTTIPPTSEDEAPKNIRYEFAQVHTLKPGAMVNLMPVVSGGRPDNFTIWPPLPQGLKLDHSTGEVKGVLEQHVRSGNQTYTVKASNHVGEATSQIIFKETSEAPTNFSYGMVDCCVVGKEVKLQSNFQGGQHISFRVHPPLPNGLRMNSSTGEIRGVLESAAFGQSKFLVTAMRSGWAATTQLVLIGKSTPSLTYEGIRSSYAMGDHVKLLPKVRGFEASHFTVHPLLPQGLELDKTTGIIRGVIRPWKNHTESQGHNSHAHMVTAWGSEEGGKTVKEQVIFNMAHKNATYFPWWIALVALVLCCNTCLVLCLCVQTSKDDKGSYKQLPVKTEPAPLDPELPTRDTSPETKVVVTPVTEAAEQQEANSGVPLIWDTLNGSKTVYATKKPLGVQFRAEFPLKIKCEPLGHGKELGLEVGWTLRSVKGVDVSKMTDIKKVNELLYQEVGEKTVPLDQWKEPEPLNTPTGVPLT